MSNAKMVSLDSPDAEDREHDDLVALIESPGWRIVCQQAASRHSASAQIADMKRLMSGLTPSDEPGARQTLGQVMKASEAVIEMIEWPVVRLQQIKTAKAKRPPGVPEAARRA